MKDKELRKQLHKVNILEPNGTTNIEFLHVPGRVNRSVNKIDSAHNRINELTDKVNALLSLLEIEEIEPDCKKKLKMGDKETEL